MARETQTISCRVSPDRLAAGFDKMGPWVSGFVINDKHYGSKYMAAQDPRVHEMLNAFPEAMTVMELGCLEGGHSLAMIEGGIAHVTAVEARSSNVVRASYIRSIYGHQDKITIVPADLEKFELASLGKADVVFCCGVLYHMNNPRRLLEQMSLACTMGAYIWTHYHARSSTWMPESGPDDPLSGTSPKSLWLSKSTLNRMIAEVGFKIASQECDENANGPAMRIVLKK